MPFNTGIDPFSRRLFSSAGTVPLREGRGPVVLVYHSLSPGSARAGWQWALSPERFRQQMVLLSEAGWSTVTVSELRSRDDWGPKTAAVTFDDGYLDNYEHGFHVLRQLGMRATWFIVSADVGGKSRWADENAAPRSILHADQLRSMAEAGMEIGSHTRTHALLPVLGDRTVVDEVAGSREDLERILGRGVSSLAYPFGKFDERCESAAREAGYVTACTTEPGWLGTDGNPFRVRRVTIFGQDSLSTFARKLAFADNAVGWRKMGRYVWSRAKGRLVGQ